VEIDSTRAFQTTLPFESLKTQDPRSDAPPPGAKVENNHPPVEPADSTGSSKSESRDPNAVSSSQAVSGEDETSDRPSIDILA